MADIFQGVDKVTYIRHMKDRAKQMMSGQEKVLIQDAVNIFQEAHININAKQLTNMAAYDGDFEYISQDEMGVILATLDAKLDNNGIKFNFDENIETSDQPDGDLKNSLFSLNFPSDIKAIMREFGVEFKLKSSNTSTPTSANTKNLLKETEVKIEPFTAFNLSESPYIEANLAQPPYNKTKVLKMPDIPQTYIDNMKNRASKLMKGKTEISIQDVHKLLVEQGNIDEATFQILKDSYMKDPFSEGGYIDIDVNGLAGLLTLLDGQIDKTGKVIFDGHIPDGEGENLSNSLLNAKGLRANCFKDLLLWQFEAYDIVGKTGIPTSMLEDAQKYVKDPEHFAPSRTKELLDI